jgi:small subunit ribosomal protein S5
MAEQNKRRDNKSKSRDRGEREPQEFEQQIVDLARVTRVTKGGKQLSFRATLVIGDKKGRVGYGTEKGGDVQIAVEKALRKAKKNLITVPIVNETIPHQVLAKFKAGKILMKPAPKGSGIIAGSAVRTVLELAGVPNASAKMVGKTNNKITNVKAAFDALGMFLPEAVAKAKARSARTPRVTPVAVSPIVIEEEETFKGKTTTKKPAAKKPAAKKA